MEGSKVGRYEVKQPIGQGGMATVFAAHDPRFGRDVAVKILPKEFLHDPTFRTRFEREAKAIAALEHPAILPVYDFGEEDGQPYLVMRLMGGGSLSSRIERGPLPLGDAIDIVERIGSALSSAHSHGIIHRDVKPSNILFDVEGNPYIADFGIVKISEGASQLTGSGVVGTPAYMAPEMSQLNSLTPLIDIYALGVTLYQMLAGEMPYQADTPIGLIMAHATKPVPLITSGHPELPEDIQLVIDRALAKEPTDRYQIIDDMVRDLRAIAASGNVNVAATRMGPRPAGASPQDRTGRIVPQEGRTMPGAPNVSAALPARSGSGRMWLLGGIAALLLIGGSVAAWQFGLLPFPAASAQPSPTVETVLVESSPTSVSLMPTIKSAWESPVEVLSSSSANYTQVDFSQALAPGDTIRSASDAAAIMTFAKGVSAEVHPGSEVRVQRMEAQGETLFVSLIQLSGKTYHWVTPAQEGLKVDYQVATRVGVVRTVGTRFWIIQNDQTWLFIPDEGTISLDLGDLDDDESDDYLAHAANGECLQVDAAGAASLLSPCPDHSELITLTSDGEKLVLLSPPAQTTATATKIVGQGGGAGSGPTNTAQAGCSCQGIDYVCQTGTSFNSTQCGGTGICHCRGENNSTLACPDGTFAQFNPSCMGGGPDCGGTCMGTFCGDGVCQCCELPGAQYACPSDCP